MNVTFDSIFTETTEREMDESIYSDLYKDVYGVRPRHINMDEWSDEELRAQMARLSTELAEVMAEEATRRRARGMEICFALHHPQGLVQMADPGYEYDGFETPLTDEVWLDYHLDGTYIPTPPPRVTLGSAL